MVARYRIRASLAALALALLLAASLPLTAGAPRPIPPVTVPLTSITIDPKDASGTTTNEPGAWSANLANPLSQLALYSGGELLNATDPALALGEVAIPLRAGANVKLYGTGVFPSTTHYEAVLYFDGRAIGPQVAVYNANGSHRRFQVQAAGTTIMGGASGGPFFERAPGTSAYTAPDGTTVKVLAFTIGPLIGAQDLVSEDKAAPDGTPDMVATLVLKVTSPKVRQGREARADSREGARREASPRRAPLRALDPPLDILLTPRNICAAPRVRPRTRLHPEPRQPREGAPCPRATPSTPACANASRPTP